MASSSAYRADLSEHRRKHQHRRAHQDYDRRLSEARGLSDRREVVNKIASIDIWATERLYKKWQREALAARHRSTHSPDQDPSMFNYSATQQPAYKRQRDRDGGKYFAASMAQQINNKRIRTATMVDLENGGRGGNALQPHLHRCQNRRRAQSRPDELRQNQQHFKQSVQPKHKHHREPSHSRRHLSLTNAAEPHAHCQCTKVQQQKVECHSERTSEIDWPDSWPSIWGSTVPQCAQRVSSNSDRQVAVDVATDSRRQERSKDKRLRRRQQSGSRGDAGQHAIAGKDTVEAVLMLNPGETADANNAKLQLVGRENNTDNSPISAMHGVTHPQLNQANPIRKEQRTKSQSVGFNAHTAVQNASTILEKRQHQFNIVGFEDLRKTDALENEFNVARLERSEKFRQEQAKTLPKPVVWMIANEPPESEQTFGSDEDRVNFNNEVRFRETADDRKVFNATFGSTDAVSHQQPAALHYFAATTIASHNSTDCKSLKMLSSATNEREEEEEIQTYIGGPMRAAQISYMKSTIYYRVTASLEPEVRMHSNTASNKSINSDPESEDDDGIIHTAQEFGEPKSMEPKTGTVTRRVQVEVLRAAQLMAAKGFAGLIGSRPSELDSDNPSTTDTLDSTKDDDDDDYDMGDRDSLGEIDDLEDDDNEEFDDERIYSKGKSSADTASLSSSSSSDERGRGNDSKRSLSRRQSTGDDERLSRYSSQKRPVAAAAPPPEKMALPMTQCPTTRHRIECFTTRSGQVKCYMTARHPVKCRVEGGRIVCKATVNAESSNLPYPCYAAWQ